ADHHEVGVHRHVVRRVGGPERDAERLELRRHRRGDGPGGSPYPAPPPPRGGGGRRPRRAAGTGGGEISARPGHPPPSARAALAGARTSSRASSPAVRRARTPKGTVTAAVVVWPLERPIAIGTSSPSSAWTSTSSSS